MAPAMREADSTSMTWKPRPRCKQEEMGQTTEHLEAKSIQDHMGKVAPAGRDPSWNSPIMQMLTLQKHAEPESAIALQSLR
eukprot:6715827-Prorocentrum_lima.AAC.1